MKKQHKASLPAYPNDVPSEFLAKCMREASNVEMEWLWAAEQVDDSNERRYCLERALYINPDNHATRSALSRLHAEKHPIAASPSVRVKRIPLLGS